MSLPADLTAQVKLYAGAKNMKVSRVHEVALTNFFLDVNEKENER